MVLLIGLRKEALKFNLIWKRPSIRSWKVTLEIEECIPLYPALGLVAHPAQIYIFLPLSERLVYYLE